jgi:hypothetical protein
MKNRLLPIVAVFGIFLASVTSAQAQKLKPEDVLAKHLDSIATAEKRAELKSFVATGEVRLKNITRKNPPSVGRVVLASRGNQSFVGMSLNSNDNPVEMIVFDGKRTRVDYTLPGQRSLLGSFLQSNSMMIEHGLYTGALSTNWSMFHTSGRNPKLSYGGTKKIDGTEAHTIKYMPKGGSDFEVTMFFDSSNFRHIRTEYKRTASASLGITIDQSARQLETRFRIVEDYSDFKESEGYTLPHKYKMMYSISGQNGTTEVEWEFDIADVAFNRPMEDATFSADQK